MAGRITYRHPELHNDGGWVSPVILSKEVLTQIEEIIGRYLSTEEIATIARNLADIRTIKTGFKEATNQDVKRTLASFLKLSPFEATGAFNESDTTTKALIDEALVCDLGFSDADFLCPSGENIKKAASIAHNNLAPSSKRRPIKGYRRILALYALNLWEQLGLKPCLPWAHGDKETPIVLFLMALSEVIDNEKEKEKLDPRDAAILLKEEKIKR